MIKYSFNKELMKLYQTEKVNPLSGCFVMLIQAPVFFALYKILFVTIEMRHAEFLWVDQRFISPRPYILATFIWIIGLQPSKCIIYRSLAYYYGYHHVLATENESSTCRSSASKNNENATFDIFIHVQIISSWFGDLLEF